MFLVILGYYEVLNTEKESGNISTHTPTVMPHGMI